MTEPSINGKLISELGEQGQKLYDRYVKLQEELKALHEEFLLNQQQQIHKAGASDQIVQLLQELAADAK